MSRAKREDVGAAGARARKVGRAVAWEWPWFLPALARAFFVESADVETMDVALSGMIRINPAYASTLSDRQLATDVCHELLHPMLRHHLRAGERDGELWNESTDRALNQILREMGIMRSEDAPTYFLPEPGHEKWSAEQIYDDAAAKRGPKPPKPQGGAGSGSGNGEKKPGRGCGLRGDDGDGKGAGGEKPGDGEKPGAGSGSGDESGEGSGAGSAGGDEGDDANEWRVIAAQAAAMAAGRAGGDAFVRALLPPPARVDWRRALRAVASRAVAAHGRDEQSFSRRSRRSPPDVILPGWKATRATASVIVDSSGSVTDEFLAEMVAEIVKISRETGCKIFLVVHDAVVQHAGWLDGRKAENIQSALRGRGGTRFEPAYRAVETAGRRIDAGIHMTDGFNCEHPNWPAKPANVRRFTAAIWGNGPREKPADGELLLVSR